MSFEQDGAEVGNSIIEADPLPAAARHADALLTIDVTGGVLTQVTYEPTRTETRKQAAQDRFDQLSARPPRDATEPDPVRCRSTTTVVPTVPEHSMQSEQHRVDGIHFLPRWLPCYPPDFDVNWDYLDLIGIKYRLPLSTSP